ncbi:YhcH/YjgK/YiaL family protein [Paenibacillus solisilvae]|uniref:YhcH/YjgK/YiaL family protein n=1 Tax=Paenibacillus solisilvae TaxID=2486751 RepID=A0ABW0VPQ2_9BACL
MIYSDLTNWEKERATFPEPVRRAIERLQQTDLDALPAGKHEFGEPGMFLLINEVTTQEKSRVKPESHQLHTDIQLVLSGRERMYVAKVSEEQIITDNRYETQDIAFYEHVQHENYIDLVPGDFIVLFPTDIHRPNCSVSEDTPLRKAVVKVHRDLFGASQPVL